MAVRHLGGCTASSSHVGFELSSPLGSLVEESRIATVTGQVGTGHPSPPPPTSQGLAGHLLAHCAYRGPLSDSYYMTNFLACGPRVPDAGYHG